jgi:hypothetical protein
MVPCGWASIHLDFEKRRPQPATKLANNPTANAANGEEAGHWATMIARHRPVKPTYVIPATMENVV